MQLATMFSMIIFGTKKGKLIESGSNLNPTQPTMTIKIKYKKKDLIHGHPHRTSFSRKTHRYSAQLLHKRFIYTRVEALQNTVDELSKTTSNPNGVNLPALLSHNLSIHSWIIFPMNQSKNSYNVLLMQGMLKTYHKAHAKMISLRKSN